MRRIAPLAFFSLLLVVGARQIRAQDVDVTGTWELSWENPRGTTTTTFLFAQDGTALTGRAQMAMGGRSMTFTFQGTVTGDTMEGTMTTPRGENPFTGKRKEI
jgi:hypothetical protein